MCWKRSGSIGLLLVGALKRVLEHRSLGDLYRGLMVECSHSVRNLNWEHFSHQADLDV